MTETAHTAFARRYSEAHQALEDIRTLLFEANKLEQQSPENWGHVGSMAEVAQRLAVIRGFLGIDQSRKESE